MFKLLKNLKSSNYYYYEDIEELEFEEQAAKQTKLNTTVQSVDEMANRVEALKKQVELLKKRNSEESEKLKKQVKTLLNINEGLERKLQLTNKDNEYYQTLEIKNRKLEAELVKKAGSVTSGSDKNSEKKIRELEAELINTKQQLVKYIKHESDKVEQATSVNKQETLAFKQELVKLKEQLLMTKKESGKLFEGALTGLVKKESNYNKQNKKQP